MDITKLKIKLRLADTFLGSVAYMVNYKEDKDIPIAGTDGSTIYYNPEALDNLSSNEQIGVLAHECCHVALNHVGRCEMHNYDKTRWNIATDMVINEYLDRLSKITLPKGVLYPPKNLRGLSSEEVYEKLKSTHLKVPSTLSNDLKECSNPTECKSMVYQSQLSEGAKDFSIGSGEFTRVFSELFQPPKLKWNNLLRKYIDERFPDDYSWKKPNRRMLNYCYLPSICDGDGLKKVKVYLDVSGSIDQGTLDIFLSEVSHIFKNLKLDSFKLIFWSTCLDLETDFTENFRIEDIPSSGGTYIAPVIEDINKSKNTVSIIFTDGYFNTKYIKDAKYPIIWVIYGNTDFKPVKGKVVELDIG